MQATDIGISDVRQAYAHVAVRLECAFQLGRTVRGVNPLVTSLLPAGTDHLIYFSA